MLLGVDVGGFSWKGTLKVHVDVDEISATCEVLYMYMYVYSVCIHICICVGEFTLILISRAG